MIRPITLAAAYASMTVACAHAPAAPREPSPSTTNGSPPSGSAPPMALGCETPEYHRLDFWLGTWDVSDPKGAYEGTNVIRRGLGGCAIEEEWLDADGWRGESIFYLDRRARVWKQLWVTQGGPSKEKTEIPGAVANGVRFEGATDATTLTAMPDGTVRQTIAPRANAPAWEGIYKRLPSQCDTPSQHELDFWIGDWTVVARSRTTPDKDDWTEAKGSNHVASILNGCAIEERFTALGGPTGTWTGRSHSTYVVAQKRWRQTWVDDSGNYIALTGGMQNGEMVLVGEPQPNGRVMRMVYTAIARDRLTWRWEASLDGQKTWKPMMAIEYTRLALR